MAVDQSNTYTHELDNWVEKQKATIEFMSALGHLMYEKNVELVIFRNTLLNKSSSEVLNLHEYAREMVSKPIDIFTTSELAALLLEMEISPSKIDIGRLAHEWLEEQHQFESKFAFLNAKLNSHIGNNTNGVEPRDVVLFGFGRIGRLAARELVLQAGKGQQLRLRAIVTRGASPAEIEKRAALMKQDSVHGAFPGTITVEAENKCIVINGQRIEMIEAKNPEDIDYTAYGFRNVLVIDNTGVFTDRTSLSRHLKAKGVEKVLLTAPGKEIPNVVYGINHTDLDVENETIYSAASCTTNAICPVLKVVNDNLGVVKGHIETVHAYTNDQNLLDNMHKKPRRGRSAAINMVITSTGAGKAVTKVIPELSDKLTANAVRVPTPNGSLAILSLEVNKETTVDQVNELLKTAALKGNLVNQINYQIEPELVSSDIIGNNCCSVFDSNATIVSGDKKNIVLYVWYDNEFGYTKQVIRMAKYIAKVRRLHYY